MKPGKIFLKGAFLFSLLFLAARLSADSQTNAFTVTSASDLHPSHQVLAFYYTWYGPDMHWGKVDVAKHDIEAARHYPAQGATTRTIPPSSPGKSPRPANAASRALSAPGGARVLTKTRP